MRRTEELLKDLRSRRVLPQRLILLLTRSIPMGCLEGFHRGRDHVQRRERYMVGSLYRLLLLLGANLICSPCWDPIRICQGGYIAEVTHGR